MKSKTCENAKCGKAFTPRRRTQRFCTAECRWAQWSHKNPRLRGLKFDDDGNIIAGRISPPKGEA